MYGLKWYGQKWSKQTWLGISSILTESFHMASLSQFSPFAYNSYTQTMRQTGRRAIRRVEKEKQKEEFVSMVQITSLLDVFLVLIMINRSSFILIALIDFL